jgi:ubiquinol-cytochrome c reductase cytochrome b/c1 subunit
MQQRTILAFAIAALLTGGAAGSAANAAEALHPPRQSWSFSGPFGKYDQAQLQRGFKVYREVCQACHSLSLVYFRNLAEPGGPGFSVAQAETIAAEYQVRDGPNDQGEMFERPGRLADAFPRPFPNDAAARVANGGVLPPDMSVIAKARTYERGFPWFVLDMFTQYQEQGPDYIAALMLGYRPKPADMNMAPNMTYNMYFPGHAIGMPAPLQAGQITYDDGAPATLEQYGKDIAAFLMWTAEPHLVARKRLGLQVMIFLIVFAGLLYFTKKKVWHAVELDPEVLEKKS